MGTPIGQYFSPSVLSRALRKQCRCRSDIPLDVILVKNGVIEVGEIGRAVQQRPQMLLLPLRLGAERFNRDYSVLIKTSLASPHSIGIIGGKTNRAFYIVGYQDESVLFLDPHILRPTNNSLDEIAGTREYHTRTVCELSIAQLDPTLLFGFLCTSPDDVRRLVGTLASAPVPMTLFSIS